MKHLQQVDLGELSGVRLINSAEYGQVIVNGDNLTNFIGRRVPNPLEPYIQPGDSFWSDGYPGTTYFPINGYMGREWRIPKQLFRENGRLDMFLIDGVGFGHVPKLGITMNLPNKTVDYYLGGYEEGKDPYFVVNRDESAPARPGYFKIRVLNLSIPLGIGFGNPAGNFRDLSGPVSLTYADGTPVDPKTSHVGYDKRVSEYIELPYGKYEFRILNQTGWQIPGTDGSMSAMTLDPPTGSADLDFLKPNYLVYAPIHSYQPGAVYTILVHPSLFRTIQRPVPFMINEEFQNAFRVIQDSPPMANTQFCRLQGFNALPGATIRLKLNGKETGTSMPYATDSGYEILQAGKFQIEATNQEGKVLAATEYALQSNQNYTVWAYPAKDGTARLSVVANDMSGEISIRGNLQGNAAYNINIDYMPFAKRFLNLCPDLPYLSFTLNNGQPLGGAEVTNLAPGVPVVMAPYVASNLSDLHEIMAYRSAPGLVPGVWADDIPVLHSQNFIASKELYTQVGSPLPAQEPGYYTVAVIGRTGNGVPPAHKARMVILKHNK